MSALDGIESTLRRWGVNTLVDTVPGYPGTFAPTHVMVHHTASAPPAAAPSARVVRQGRPGIPGPLCHLLVRRDLKVEVVSRGRANHAGKGSWPGIGTDEGNRRCVGIEIEHAGTSAEEWTPAYMAFCRLVVASTLDHLTQPATHLVAHKEYAPQRKVDPFRWVMDAERREVARVLAAGPIPKPAPIPEDDMTPPEFLKLLNETELPLGEANSDLLGQPDGRIKFGELLVATAGHSAATNRLLAETNDLLEKLIALHTPPAP